MNAKESVRIARRTNRLLWAAWERNYFPWVGRWALGFLSLCLLSVPALAQTTVTGTIVDPISIPYSNCTVQAVLTLPGGSPLPSGPTTGINTPVPTPVPANCDVNGTFVMSLQPNAAITPAGTFWQFQVTMAGIAPPIGTGPRSFTVNNVTIAGASQNVSAALSAAVPALTAISLGGGTITGSGANTQCAFWTAATVLAGDAGCTYNSATDTLTVGTGVVVGNSVLTSGSLVSSGATMNIGDGGAGRWQSNGGDWLPTVNNLFSIGNSTGPNRVLNLFMGAGQVNYAQGTITTSTPPWTHTATWNAGGVTFVNFDSNITDSASAAGSILMRLRVGGVSQFEVTKAGLGTFAGAIAAAGGTLTAPLTITQGTITTSQPFVSHTATWNAGGVTFVNFDSNVTDTASAAGSILARFRVGGSSVFEVLKTGQVNIGGSGVASIEITTGALGTSTGAGNILLGSNTGDVLSVSEGGGAVTPVIKGNRTSYAYRVCTMIIGAENGSALVDADLGPQRKQCQIPFAYTVVEVDVSADGGTPNVIAGKRTCTASPCVTGANETVVNLTSAALATASSGGSACSKTGATTGIDGFTTCSATLQNTSGAAGSWIELVSGTAGGVAKRMSVSVFYTVN